MRRATWWRRNRLWLALLVPLLLPALAASSYRLTTLYLRWEWSQPVVVQGSGTYTQTFRDVQDIARTRTVTVEVKQVARTTQADGDQWESCSQQTFCAARSRRKTGSRSMAFTPAAASFSKNGALGKAASAGWLAASLSG